MGDGTARGALEYLDNLVEKGKATPGAITPLKIAFTKVIQIVDGDTWDNTAVASIDIDDYMGRFANLTMGKYTSDSLIAYKSRLGRVINWYTQFLAKPGWTPNLQRRLRTPKNNTPEGKAKLKTPDTSNATPNQVVAPQQTIVNEPGRIVYPYPLLDGQLIHLSLPVKLSKNDARRIGAFVESIAMTESEDRA